MDRRERYTVAVTLASSLLQLHGTPWLHDCWSKADIVLHPTETNDRLVPEPLLRMEFYSKPNTMPLPQQATSTLPLKKFNPRTALCGLGIMLLELCFNQPIELHPSRKQYFGPNNEPNAFTDIATAKEWHEEVLRELGPDISDAIRRCLDCSFAPRPDLEDQEFQEAVFDGVVLPLQDLLRVWQDS